MRKLAAFLVTLKNDHGFDGNYGEFDYKWTVPNAVLFTMTTLTMIGYGVIAPRTESGKSYYNKFFLLLIIKYLRYAVLYGVHCVWSGFDDAVPC